MNDWYPGRDPQWTEADCPHGIMCASKGSTYCADRFCPKRKRVPALWSFRLFRMLGTLLDQYKAAPAKYRHGHWIRSVVILALFGYGLAGHIWPWVALLVIALWNELGAVLLVGLCEQAEWRLRQAYRMLDERRGDDYADYQ